MNKIICTHLYNDFSGSPLVLSTAIKNFIANGSEVEIITSENSEGFLSNINGATYNGFNYDFYKNKFIRLFALLWSQIVLFFKIIKYRNEEVIVYINTLLPFGAALAGKLTGKKVIYHMHETTVNPPVLKSFLKNVATFCATDAIYVSRFLMEQEPLTGVHSEVVYNCLSLEFSRKATEYLAKKPIKRNSFTTLMLCSLKEYKGVNEFVKLAQRLSEYRFVLVLNADEKAIKRYFLGQKLSDNLIVFPSQKTVHTFYQEAHLVLNLSHPEKWVETFGMTLLEAMAYGVPVIAPPVGGPVELVTNGFNGYQTHQADLDKLASQVSILANDKVLYTKMSTNAIFVSKKFTVDVFRQRLEEIVLAKRERVLGMAS